MALVIGGRISSSSNNHIVMLVAAAILLTVATTTVSASFICGGIWVYPFESPCTSPARYYGEEVYELGDSFLQGRLAPEWDESNSTYYVRLAEEGAKYKFEHWPTLERRYAVAQFDDVRIVNVETGRALGWRREGAEWFLVEVEQFGGAAYRFVNHVGKGPSPPCPSIYPPWSCGVYSILNFVTPSFGLSPYVEDNATYFKLSPLSWTNTFAFRLRATPISLPLLRSPERHP